MIISLATLDTIFQFKEVFYSDPEETLEEIAQSNNSQKAIVCYLGLDWCPPVRWTYDSIPVAFLLRKERDCLS